MKRLEIVIDGKPERTWWFGDSVDMRIVERDIADFITNHIEKDHSPPVPFLWIKDE